MTKKVKTNITTIEEYKKKKKENELNNFIEKTSEHVIDIEGYDPTKNRKKKPNLKVVKN